MKLEFVSRVKVLLVSGLLAALLMPGLSAAGELCVFLDERGAFRQVNGRDAVPPGFQAQARCIEERSGEAAEPGASVARLPLQEPARRMQAPVVSNRQLLVSPEEIDLSGNVRREEISSDIGRISLRWPRSAEVLFGRTPSRAMADAARTVSRTLRRSGFPPVLARLSLDWNVVFMDAKVPETQVPAYLINNCHPAWMTPPANLYIVSERVASGCGGGRGAASTGVADSELTQVLLHEMGHAVEFALLSGREFARLSGGQEVDRARAEGFATWFEAYAAEESGIIRKGSVLSQQRTLAREAYRTAGQFVFRGSGSDYARASMSFHAIVERRGLRGLMQVYEALSTKKGSFDGAVQSALGWSKERLEEEARRVAGK